MKIDSTQFCALSTSDKFLRWLSTIESTIYDGLIGHLQQGLGCGANRKKMVDILGDLVDSGHSQDLEKFLRENYPGVIRDDAAEQAPQDFERLNAHGVFQHYDPTLATFPRRLIITFGDTGNRGLLDSVMDFCATQGYCEYVEVGDRCYIEYLPKEYTKLKDDIPDENWQVRAHKRKQ